MWLSCAIADWTRLMGMLPKSKRSSLEPAGADPLSVALVLARF